MSDDPKADLLRYLQVARDAVLWKLDGLSEYDARRPLTRTGTNLLGLVKHLTAVETGYFGEVFGRPSEVPQTWSDEEDDADLWATPQESREEVVGRYRQAWAHTDATVAALELDAAGRVPWWGEGQEVTLQLVLLHVVAETHRHAGHADLVRELVDGAAGYRADDDNLPPIDDAGWARRRERLEQVARQAGGV